MTSLSLLFVFEIIYLEATSLYNPFTHKHILHDSNFDWNAINTMQSTSTSIITKSPPMNSTSAPMNYTTQQMEESRIEPPIQSSPKRKTKTKQNIKQQEKEEQQLLMNAIRAAQNSKQTKPGKLVIYYADYECIIPFEEDLVRHKQDHLLIIPGYSFLFEHEHNSVKFAPPLNHSTIKTLYDPLDFAFLVSSKFFSIIHKGPVSYAEEVKEWATNAIYLFQLSKETKLIFTKSLSHIKPIIESENQKTVYEYIINAFYRNQWAEIPTKILTSKKGTQLLVHLISKCLSHIFDVLFANAVEMVRNNDELWDKNWSDVFAKMGTNFKSELQQTIDFMMDYLVDRKRNLITKGYAELMKIKQRLDTVLLCFNELKAVNIVNEWSNMRDKKYMDIDVLFHYAAVEEIPILELVWRDVKYRKNETVIIENHRVKQSRHASKKKFIIFQKEDNKALKEYKKTLYNNNKNLSKD